MTSDFLSELEKRWAKDIQRLKDRGAVRVALDQIPDFRYDTIDIVLYVKGYIRLTEKILYKDFVEWKLNYDGWWVDEEDTEDDTPYYFIDDSSRIKAYTRITLTRANAESKLRKEETKDMTIDQWAVREGEAATLRDVREGKTIYRMTRLMHKIEFGREIMETIPESAEIIAMKIQVMFNKMFETIDKDFAHLPKEVMESIKKAPRLPHIIYVGEEVK